MFKKKNRVYATDITDACWDFLDEWDKEKNVFEPNATWKEFGEIVCKKYSIVPSSEYVIEHGVMSWLWEKEFLFEKPVREMKYLYGEHVATLFDCYGCVAHRVVVTASFSSFEQVDPNQTVLCPICNADKIRSGEKYPLKWDVVPDERWEQELKWSRRHIQDVRWSNFKFFFKNPRMKWYQFKRWAKKTVGIES